MPRFAGSMNSGDSGERPSLREAFFGGDWEHGNCHLMEEVEVLRLSAVWTPSIYDIVDNKLEHATGDRGSALKWLAFCSISSFPPRPT
jgi:hypothetical protein